MPGAWVWGQANGAALEGIGPQGGNESRIDGHLMWISHTGRESKVLCGTQFYTIKPAHR